MISLSSTAVLAMADIVNQFQDKGFTVVAITKHDDDYTVYCLQHDPMSNDVLDIFYLVERLTDGAYGYKRITQAEYSDYKG